MARQQNATGAGKQLGRRQLLGAQRLRAKRRLVCREASGGFRAPPIPLVLRVALHALAAPLELCVVTPYRLALTVVGATPLCGTVDVAHADGSAFTLRPAKPVVQPVHGNRLAVGSRRTTRRGRGRSGNSTRRRRRHQSPPRAGNSSSTALTGIAVRVDSADPLLRRSRFLIAAPVVCTVFATPLSCDRERGVEDERRPGRRMGFCCGSRRQERTLAPRSHRRHKRMAEPQPLRSCFEPSTILTYVRTYVSLDR